MCKALVNDACGASIAGRHNANENLKKCSICYI